MKGILFVIAFLMLSSCNYYNNEICQKKFRVNIENFTGMYLQSNSEVLIRHVGNGVYEIVSKKSAARTISTCKLGDSIFAESYNDVKKVFSLTELDIRDSGVTLINYAFDTRLLKHDRIKFKNIEIDRVEFVQMDNSELERLEILDYLSLAMVSELTRVID